MAKLLKKIIANPVTKLDNPKDGLTAKVSGNPVADFVAKHKVEKIGDAEGNGDDVFQATNIKKAKHPRADEEVQLDEAKSEKIGHLTKHPFAEIHIVHTRSKVTKKPQRDVMMKGPGKSVPLHRAIPDHWGHKEIADHLEKRDASRFHAAGGVTWHHKKNEEVELEEGKSKDSDDGRQKFGKFVDRKKARLSKREKDATDESVQMDEISDKTLKSYVSKARDDFSNTREKQKDNLKKPDTKENEKEWDSLERRANQRHNNIERAKRKIKFRHYNEDEQLDELSKTTLKSYKEKAGRDNMNMALHGVGSGKQFEMDRGKYMAKRRGSMAMAKKKLGEEEQLDELSRATRASYTVKAASNMARRAVDADRHWSAAKASVSPNERHKNVSRARAADKKVTKRMDGIRRAQKEETDLNELSKKTLGSYVKKSVNDRDVRRAAITDRNVEMNTSRPSADKRIRTVRANRKDLHKIKMRGRYHDKAVDKITKEETLDEISKNLATRYYNKANDDELRLTQKYNSPLYGGKGPIKDPKEKAKVRRKVDNRQTGMDRAYKRMRNEEEQLDELSKDLLLRYQSKAAQDISKRGGLGIFKPGNTRKLSKRAVGISRSGRKIAGGYRSMVPATEK